MTELRNVEADLSRFRLRVLVASIAVLLGFALLAGRLVYLQVVRHDDLQEQAESNRTAIVPIVPNRGLILDRNGITLATNYSAYTLEITPSRLGRALDNVCDIAEEHGLEASYHPHLSTIVENPDELKIIMGRSRIAFCPDTAHLAAGGGDPAELIRTYPDRVKHVHLKDLQPQPFTFMPLGKGVLDFVDIVAALKESGYDSWLMVELDSYDGEPKDAAQISKDHLEQLLADAGIRRG